MTAAVNDSRAETDGSSAADAAVRSAGYCPTCHYDLAGLTPVNGAITCPECGKPAPSGSGVVGVLAQVHTTDHDGRTAREWIAAPTLEQIEDDVYARGLILNGITLQRDQEAFDRLARGEVRLVGQVDPERSVGAPGPVCCKCGYALEGLAVQHGAIRCPECSTINATYTARTLPAGAAEIRLSTGDGILLVVFVVAAVFPPLLILSGIAALATFAATDGRTGLAALACHLAVLMAIVAAAIVWSV